MSYYFLVSEIVNLVVPNLVGKLLYFVGAGKDLVII